MTNGLAVPDGRALAGVRYAVGVAGARRPEGFRHRRRGRIARTAVPALPRTWTASRTATAAPRQDNDRDGVADDDDECPDDAEEPGRHRDGCPDRPRVVVRKGKMTVYGKVLFPLESSKMLPQS